MVSHRYDRLPLLPFDPGGVQRELVVPDLPGCKNTFFYSFSKKTFYLFLESSQIFIK